MAPQRNLSIAGNVPLGSGSLTNEIHNVSKRWAPGEMMSSNNDNALKIGLGVGLGLLGLVVILLLFCLYCRTRKRTPVEEPCPEKEAAKLAAANSVLTRSNSYVKQNPKKVDDPWQLNRMNLSIDYEKKLGSGAFCNVFKGHIVGNAPVYSVYPGHRTLLLKDCEVAVKMLPSFADESSRSDFLQEINFMKSLEYHAHLVSMLGYVDDFKNPLLLVEFCERGDLLHYVRNKKKEIIEGPDNFEGLKIKDLLGFSWQISNGLEYLNSVGCIHRDVAARNVLIDRERQCKIGDFGLCRLTDSLLYTARGGRLPLKWMAPESLETYEYSFKSDVWSYGVLLWEMFSLGEVPYNLVQSSELLQHLQGGARLEQPDTCTNEIYNLMDRCWKYEASHRPTFNEICVRLASMLESATAYYGYLSPLNETVMIDDV